MTETLKVLTAVIEILLSTAGANGATECTVETGFSVDNRNVAVVCTYEDGSWSRDLVLGGTGTVIKTRGEDA